MGSHVVFETLLPRDNKWRGGRWIGGGNKPIAADCGNEWIALNLTGSFIWMVGGAALLLNLNFAVCVVVASIN